MYYLVIFDERPKDTEHITTGGKNVPVYKFTIPEGKTWAEPNMWFTVEYPLNNPPDWQLPLAWVENKPANLYNAYNSDFWPNATVTGDVFFGIGLTHDS